MEIKLFVVLTGLLFTSLFFTKVVFAECLPDLETEKMMECIMIEGSGDTTYQDWSKGFDQSASTNQSVRDNNDKKQPQLVAEESITY